MSYIAASIPEGADMQGLTLQMLMAIQILSAVTVAPFINMFVALGEEIGWRGYMTPMLTARLGRKPALILSGIIWGVWHWPIVVGIGYNYGTDYFGEPFTGMLMMCLMSAIFGTLLSYLYDKSKCIWIPSLAHGAINAIAAVPLIFSDGSITSYLLGPIPTGLLGLIPFGIIAAIVFFAHKNREISTVENQ
ncbi:MAG: CPBP family intramembrane metalloprotease, partial [Firmicutes bacterium]|nr:CPBP family intramembrane metalloprotease [Bacillota bacterium]